MFYFREAGSFDIIGCDWFKKSINKKLDKKFCAIMLTVYINLLPTLIDIYDYDVVLLKILSEYKKVQFEIFCI